MTLLVALVDDLGGVVVAADGEETSLDGETWGSEPREKFFPVVGQHLMWGWSGVSDVGLPFGDWLRAEAPMGEWEGLRAVTGAKFREICVASEVSQGDGSAAVVAGWFGETPGILRVDFTGQADVRQTRVFEGAAKWAALWGWE